MWNYLQSVLIQLLYSPRKQVRQGGLPLGKEKEFFDQDACRKQKIRENARVTTVKTKEEQSGGTVD